MTKFLQSLSVSDYLNEMASDAQDTLVNTAKCIPGLSIVFDENLSEGMIIESVEDKLPVTLTINGYPFRVESVTSSVDESLHQVRLVKMTDDATDEFFNLMLYAPATGEVINGFKGSGLLEFCGQSARGVLQEAMSSYEVSQVLNDCITAVKGKTKDAVDAFYAKYSGPLSNLTSGARRVYLQIADMFGKFGNDYTAVYSYLTNFYGSLRSARVDRVGNRSRLAFGDTDYYVAGYFGGYRLASTIVSGLAFVTYIVGMMTAPVVAAVGAAISGIAGLVRNVYTEVSADTAYIDKGALNTCFAQTIADTGYYQYGVERNNGAQYASILDLSRRTGIGSFVIPGIQFLFCMPDWHEGDPNAIVRSQTLIRPEVISDRPFNVIGADHSEDVELRRESCAVITPISFFTRQSGEGVLAWPIANSQDKAYYSWLGRVQTIGSPEFRTVDGNQTAYASDEYDAQLRCAIMHSLQHIIAIGCQKNPAYVNQMCAANKVVYNQSRDRYSWTEELLDAVHTNNIWKLFNAIFSYDDVAYKVINPGELTWLGWAPEWEDLVNKVIPMIQSLSEWSNMNQDWWDFNSAMLAFVSCCIDPSNTGSYDFLNNPRNKTYSATTDFPDRANPYIRPPKYSTSAFLRTLAIFAGVTAVIATVVVATLRVSHFVDNWIGKQQLDLEAARYAYEENPTQENYTRYLKLFRRYNWIARATGNARLSRVNGYEIDSETGDYNTLSVLDSIRSFTGNQSAGDLGESVTSPVTIAQVYKSITGQ